MDFKFNKLYGPSSIRIPSKFLIYLTFHEKGNNIVGMCAGFKIKSNGCNSFVIPDYEDNCYRLDFSGVTIPCLVPMANLHPLSVRMN